MVLLNISTYIPEIIYEKIFANHIKTLNVCIRSVHTFQFTIYLMKCQKTQLALTILMTAKITLIKYSEECFKCTRNIPGSFVTSTIVGVIRGA